MILRLLARRRTGRRTAIPARTVETPRRSSVNLFKGHTTRWRYSAPFPQVGIITAATLLDRLPAAVRALAPSAAFRDAVRFGDASVVDAGVSRLASSYSAEWRNGR